jgi:hypothetical protein
MQRARRQLRAPTRAETLSAGMNANRVIESVCRADKTKRLLRGYWLGDWCGRGGEAKNCIRGAGGSMMLSGGVEYVWITQVNGPKTCFDNLGRAFEAMERKDTSWR